MTRLLRNKNTGAVFAWTDRLSKQDFMEEYIPPAPKSPDPEEEIKTIARQVLLKKPGRKRNGMVPGSDAAVP